MTATAADEHGGGREEIETKLELTAASYERLLSTSTVLTREEQLNVYYDGDSELARRASSFRIRYSPGAATLITLKRGVSHTGGQRVSQEFETEFHGRVPPRAIPVAQLPSPLRAAAQELGITCLQRLGAMRTLRVRARLPSGDVVELDRVTLPGGALFYEAEIESSNAAEHAAAVAAVRAAAPDAQLSFRGKFFRFRETVARLRATQ